MQDDSEEEAAGAESMSPAASYGPKRARLIVLAGPNVGEMYSLQGTLLIGRGSDADIRFPDEGISRRHARLKLVAEGCEFEDLGSTSGSFVNGERIQRVLLQGGDKVQLGAATILKFAYLDSIEEDFHREMYAAAWRDPLTGICNERFFLDHLRVAFWQAARQDLPLSLIFFRVADIASIRHTFGRLGADHVLAAVARTVTPLIRSEDLFAFLGEEAFVIMSRGDGAASIADVSERIASHDFEFEGRPIPVSVTIGVARMPHADITAPEDLLTRADAARR